MRRALAWIVACSMISPGYVLGAQEDQKQQDEKAEKERRKKEDKAQQKDSKEADEAQGLLEEIQPAIDAKVLQLRESTYQDQFLQDYVTEIGQSLVPRETPQGVLFVFRVVRQHVPEAWAFPDGRVYVTHGLLSFVESEAELGVVLGHEIGHVLEKHTVEMIKESRSIKRRLLPGLIGAAAGALVGGAIKGKEGAAVGAGVGAAAGVIFSAVDFNRYGRRQEDEADTIGVRLALARGYDAKAGVSFFQRLADRFGDNDQLSNFLYAQHSRNVDRVKNIRALLDGDLGQLYNQRRTAGELSLGTGQLQLFTSRMVRDVAIEFMESDRFDIAKALLTKIADYRMRDPETLNALGRLYKAVGRTAEDRARALDYLQRATALDERNRHPEFWHDLGLMQARMAGDGQMAPALESLKKYVLGWQTLKRNDPDDLDEIYDYLLIFGDGAWTAPRMEGQMLRAAVPGPVPGPAAAQKSATPPGSKAIAAPTGARRKGQ